ncbi:hypothetical protein BTVI_14842 [Pitangus sulphuratus]|nr:hypothetical protein BTVI_14842 [Pitangus sulphuratus]
MTSDFLHHLDILKSMKPDGIHWRVLRDMAEVGVEPLSIIFNRPAVYQKDHKEDSWSYSPVSLTLIPEKVMEQITLSAIT